MPQYDIEYIRYEVGDVIREKYWIACDPTGPLYGIVVSIVRDGYTNVDWIDYGDDQLSIYWFKWHHIETLPSCFIEIVSKISGVTHENHPQEPK
jgi:hypothetical protein